jgi:hypothetical protein
VVVPIYNLSYEAGIGRKISVWGQPWKKSKRPYLKNN